MKTYDEIYNEVMNRVRDQKVRKERAMKKTSIYLSAAAAVLVIGVSGAAIYNHNKVNTDIDPTIVASNTNNTTDKNVIIKHVSSGEAEAVPGTAPANDDNPGAEIAIQPEWDGMLDCSRYGAVTYDGTEYVTKLIAVHDDHLGEQIGETTASGYDVIADEIRTRTVKIYRITGISQDVALAVRFNDEDEYTYAYVSTAYEPKSLNDLITDANMKKEFDIGVVYTGEGDNMLAYEDVTVDKVWEMLLSDGTIVNEPDKETGSKVIDITASIKVLGYWYNAMWLTEDGYLVTNLLETGKYFYIGEDKVNAFVKYVTENHQAYKYIYDDLTYDGVVEE